MKDKVGGLDNPAFDAASDPDVQDGARSRGGSVGEKKKLTVEEKAERKAILKNVIVISIAFVFLFTSYNSIANLQSSINKTDGTLAQATLYIGLVFSCLFLPSWVIKKLKVKYTIALCMLCYSTYIAAQFYPTMYTLVPTSIIVGLGAAPMWSAKCTYLTQVGTRYAFLIGDKSEVIITRFFGIFFLFFQSTQVWGNLISSTILSVGVEEVNKTDEELSLCGYNFCPGNDAGDDNDTSSDSDIPSWQIYTMSTIYLCFGLLSSVIVFIFVDPLDKFVSEDTLVVGEKNTKQLLLATFNHMRHPYQLLIVPLTIWSGLEQAFLSADYTAAYVSCAIGVHFVGYIMICYGVCDSIGSVSFSPVVKMVGRVPIFTMGFLINLAIIIALIYWQPTPDDMALFFVMAGLWGVSDAVWQTQINAFYSVIFPGESEAAFSNYRLWESVGFIISYVFSTVVCITTKVTILLVFLALGMIGYFTIEAIEWRGGIKKDRDGKVIPIDKRITGHA